MRKRCLERERETKRSQLKRNNKKSGVKMLEYRNVKEREMERQRQTESMEES